MPSELVNSVISRPQPPKPRITRRKSVSVTPAIGASRVAGRITRSRRRYCAGSEADFPRSCWRTSSPSSVRARSENSLFSVLILAFLFLRSIFQEFIEAEKLAAECGAVDGPVLFPGLASKSSAHRGHFGIQVVHVMEHQSFPNHGKLRRAKFIFAVVADENVLNDGLKFGRKAFNRFDRLG